MIRASSAFPAISLAGQRLWAQSWFSWDPFQHPGTLAPPRLPRRRGAAALQQHHGDGVAGDDPRGDDPRGDDPGSQHAGLGALHMSLEDSIKWFGEVMAEIGPRHSQKKKEWNIFDVKQANAIIDYLKISLFQHYKLYEFMFYSTREEIVIGTEQVIEVVKPADHPFPAPLEEGISLDTYSAFIEPPPMSDTDLNGLDQEQGPEETQLDTDTSDKDPLAGFTIEDVKSVLAQVTDDVLVSIQETEPEPEPVVGNSSFVQQFSRIKRGHGRPVTVYS
ncbi:ciliary-associated calcium-binding coiled-coil protein 1 isoform X4 [Castor canadensis]|uniref:Ciliary-associated calcium-binding coiled-coil protein 1 isoform X4 n=1 Tax=Castor canadensis TaxID=51338 RepID=A0AC58N0C7_CASCN